MSPWLEHIWRQLTSDRRKLFALTAALLIGMLLWGRLIFVKKVPRTAVADPEARAVEPGAGAGDGKVSGLGGPGLAGGAAGDNGGGPVSLLDRPEVHVTAPTGLERDLFAFEGRGFTLIRPSSPGSPTERKYGQSRADNEQLLRELKSRFDRMQLQTTFQVDGDWTAVIDGRFRKAGDEFDGFKIVEVRPRQVLLEVQGIEVWLSMDKR